MGSLMILFMRPFMVSGGCAGTSGCSGGPGCSRSAAWLLTLVLLILGSTGVLALRRRTSTRSRPAPTPAVSKAAARRGFGLVATFNFMVWPAFSILFAVNMVSFSGEVKNVRRGPLIGIDGSMIVTGVLMILLMVFARGAFGDRFLLAGAHREGPGAAVPQRVRVHLGNNDPHDPGSAWVFVIPFASAATSSTRPGRCWPGAWTGSRRSGLAT